MREYCHLANIYTDRRLTFDSDALNAFSGVMEMFQGPAKPVAVHNVSGFPFVPSIEDYQSQQASIFVALSWVDLAGIPKRREGFPSWTWAGWQGATNWPYVYNITHGLGVVSLLQDVLFCSEKADFAPPYGENAQDKLDSVKAIKFGAPVVSRSAFSIIPDDDLDVLLWDLKTFLGLNLDTTIPIHFLEQLEKGLWTCFLLGESRGSVSPRYFILVVEWQDEETAVRKGSFFFYGEIPDLEALERRTVKLI